MSDWIILELVVDYGVEYCNNHLKINKRVKAVATWIVSELIILNNNIEWQFTLLNVRRRDNIREECLRSKRPLIMFCYKGSEYCVLNDRDSVSGLDITGLLSHKSSWSFFYLMVRLREKLILDTAWMCFVNTGSNEWYPNHLCEKTLQQSLVCCCVLKVTRSTVC